MPIPFDPSRYVSAAVVPAVMISACGLLVLALYNRLSNIVSRLRLLLRERLREEGAAANHARGIERMLDRESYRVLRRARLVRDALVCLIGTITCMALCSLTAGLGTVWVGLSYLSLGLFAAGQVSLLAGLAFALVELVQALRPVEIESHTVETLIGPREADHEGGL